MDAHLVDTNFTFPELAAGPLDDEWFDEPRMAPATDEPMGALRGLAAAIMIQIGIVLLGIMGWQVWHFFRW